MVLRIWEAIAQGYMGGDRKVESPDSVGKESCASTQFMVRGDPT